MSRVAWLAGCAALLAIALLLARHGTAWAASDTSCAQADSYLSFCVNVPSSLDRRQTTVPMVALPAQRADVLVETSVPASEAIAIANQVDVSVSRVETLFGRAFTARPRIILFGTTASFATGTRDLFGYSNDTAVYVASTYGGIFDRPTATIAVNWSTAGPSRINAAIAHELTHLMIYDLAQGRDVPTWLDEGVATLVEESTVGAGSWSDGSDLVGRAVADSNLVSLADLTTLEGFHTAYARVGRPLYEFTAYAVLALEVRDSWAGVLALLDRIGSGTTVDRSLSESVDRSLDRSATIAVTTPDAAGNATWTLVTGHPGETSLVTITGPNAYQVTFTVQSDDLGMYRGTFGATAPRGVYTLVAGSAAATFTAGR